VILGHVSDTHNTHANKWGIQPCDVLIHSGDFSFYGKDSEINQFFVDMKKAVKDSGAKYAIIVPGNHEKGVQANEALFKERCKENNIICLIHDAVEIEGVKFFGSSWQPEFGRWAYNAEFHKLRHLYDQIPDDTQVLITHCPPCDILDYSPLCGSVGSMQLWFRVQKLLGKLKYHFFGHIHFSHGIKEFMGTKFVNSAILDDQYGLNPEDRRMQVFEL
jgi:Icc-related predicted phosphoesterase